MTGALNFLTLAQFESLYGDRKPYYEYWFGEAIQKSMPTFLHGLVQSILVLMLNARGWKTATEVKLKLSTVAEPIPDLIADRSFQNSPYPTRPFALCIEILSPADNLKQMVQKSAHYLDWGIQHVWIIDPEARIAFSMSREQPQPLVSTIDDSLTADPDLSISLRDLFEKVDQTLA